MSQTLTTKEIEIVEEEPKKNIEADIVYKWFQERNPSAKEPEIISAFYFAKLHNLDPRKNECYFIPYGGINQLVVSYKVILARAKQSPKFYREKIQYFRNGRELIGYPITSKLLDELSVVVTVYDKEGNAFGPVQFTPADLYKSNKGTFKTVSFHLWVQKVALVAAYRVLFPEYVEDLHVEEEFMFLNDKPAITLEEPKAPQYIEPSNNYKSIIEYLDFNYAEDNKSRVKLMKDFLKAKQGTKEDLINGKYTLEEFVEFEGQEK